MDVDIPCRFCFVDAAEGTAPLGIAPEGAGPPALPPLGAAPPPLPEVPDVVYPLYSPMALQFQLCRQALIQSVA